MADYQAEWQPTAELIAHETAVYEGIGLEQMADRVPAAIEMQTTAFFFSGLWRAGGLMLIGMALFKLGVLAAECATKFYPNLLIAGFGIGLPLVILGIGQNVAAGWTLEYSRLSALSLTTGAVLASASAILPSLCSLLSQDGLNGRYGRLQPLAAWP